MTFPRAAEHVDQIVQSLLVLDLATVDALQRAIRDRSGKPTKATEVLAKVLDICNQGPGRSQKSWICGSKRAGSTAKPARNGDGLRRATFGEGFAADRHALLFFNAVAERVRCTSGGRHPFQKRTPPAAVPTEPP